MSDSTSDNPVTLDSSAIPGNLLAAVRQVVLAAGGWAIGRGYLENDTLTAILTLLAVVVPFGYGQYLTYMKHSNAVDIVQGRKVGVVVGDGR